MSILKSYNKHLIKRGFNGPLSFHLPFRLGHIVTFDKKSGFEIAGHIDDDYFQLGDFTAIEHSGMAKADIDFGSETGVNIETKLKGDAKIPNSRLDIKDSGLVIDFEAKGSYLLKTEATKIHYLENIAELGAKVNHLYLQNKWNVNWFVITQLIEAERVTLLISKSSNSKIELKASGSVASTSENDLVSADVNFSVLVKKKMGINIIGKEGSYFPLFKANGVRIRRLFPRPIGSPFDYLNQGDVMNAFTNSELNKGTSEFDIVFKEYDFSDEFVDEVDAILT